MANPSPKLAASKNIIDADGHILEPVDRLFALSGGNARYDRHPLQRAFCDIQALASHAFRNPDLVAELYGQASSSLSRFM